jgi:A/G-specific adenine glycosylase|tara:strand:- start:11714 stop:12799 length:1086 start_codon:yes stop_codon:yes gene_type:complete
VVAAALETTSDYPERLFSSKLLQWFDLYGRKDLPWQHNPSAYRVWVSEVMLQQTQVSTVIPYYQRFMASFPDLKSLAGATEDQVLHHWSGLGYYARARNLHKTAKLLTVTLDGNFPESLEALETLPGIGRSTAGAICAIAYQKTAPILDGNVKRVLARHEAINGWPGASATTKILWKIAEKHTPKERTADYTQAIMDLGATLCTRTKPRCQECPIKADCKSFNAGNPESYPSKKPTKKIPTRTCFFLMILNSSGEFLLQKRPSKSLWGGLWAFPQCDHEKDISIVCEQLNQPAKSWAILSAKRHTFSHFYLDYQPVMIECYPQSALMDKQDTLWYNPDTPLEIGIAKPIASLLGEIKRKRG